MHSLFLLILSDNVNMSLCYLQYQNIKKDGKDNRKIFASMS